MACRTLKNSGFGVARRTWHVPLHLCVKGSKYTQLFTFKWRAKSDVPPSVKAGLIVCEFEGLAWAIGCVGYNDKVTDIYCLFTNSYHGALGIILNSIS